MTEIPTVEATEITQRQMRLRETIAPFIGGALCPVIGVTLGIAGISEGRPNLVVAGAVSILVGGTILKHSMLPSLDPQNLDNRGEL